MLCYNLTTRRERKVNPTQVKIAKVLKGRAKPVLGKKLYDAVYKKHSMPRGTYGPNVSLMVQSGYVDSKIHLKSVALREYSLTEAGLEALIKVS